VAQLTRIVLTDDVHGGEAIERTVFGLDGETFEIDLDEATADQVHVPARGRIPAEALARYRAAGN
jgi:hypothetical protein